MAIQYLSPSWKEYHANAQKLAATILDSAEPIDQIVAISRGGLTFGHLLSDLLRIPIATITIQSYSDILKQGELFISQKLHVPIRGKRILLVDDVADSGKTLVRALKYLKRFAPKHITTVTMFHKPRSVYKPDYYAQETTRWILFPYEVTEMIFLISKRMQKEGKSKADIQRFLKKLKYTDDQIAYVRRHHLDETRV